MTSIESHPEQYWAAAGRPGPVPLALGPVHPGGPTLIDLLMALFGLSTNADLGGTNADIEGDDTDRRAHAADAARKFSANEANAAEQMQGVGAQGMAQMASGIGGALSGALGGVMGPLTQLPQQAMQAGQGAMQPLMSAMQQAQGADGLAALPPPAIWVHHPYRRRHRRRLPRGHRPSRRRCPRPAALHLPQRTWVRPGCRWCRRARWAPGAKGAAKKSRSKSA